MNFEKLKPFQNLTKLRPLGYLNTLQKKHYQHTTKYLSQAEILLFSTEILCHTKQLIDLNYEKNHESIYLSLQTANKLLNNLDNYFDNLITKKDKKVIFKDLGMRSSSYS